MLDAEFSLADDLTLMREAAQEAGALALDWLKRGARSWEKHPGSPVTEADLAVNELLHERLRASRPGYGWLSEETADDLADRSPAETFVVDPIDGTRAFIRGLPAFTVCIARLQGAQAAVGVVLNPMTGEMFSGALGLGAWLNDKPIRILGGDRLEDALLVASPDRVRSRAGRTIWPPVRLIEPMPNSIAYRMCLVAGGLANAAFSTGKLHDWDVAAATIILQEAGAIVSDEAGASYSFNRTSPTHSGMVAAGAALHPLILEKLRKAAHAP